jgi:uncharacterized membrane protein
MSEHERTISVHAPAGEVFRYVSSVSNLSDFVPHLRDLREEEDGHVFGIADLGNGRRQEVSGFFRADEANLSLGWESDGTPGYRGSMQIVPESGDQSKVTVHIAMRGPAEQTPSRAPALDSERIERMFDDVMRALQDGLERNVIRGWKAA